MSDEAYIYGPGNSFIALKHKHVSSTSTGPSIYDVNEPDVNPKSGLYALRPTASAARLHLSVDISSTVP